MAESQSVPARRRSLIGRIDPCKARTLQPGVTGFLFSVNPRQTDKAKREAMSLLVHYTDIVLEESGASVGGGDEADRPEGGAKAHRAEGTDVAAALAEELNGGPNTGSSGRPQRKKWNSHPLLRHVDTKVKGYIFISVSQPAAPEGDDDGESDADAGEAEKTHTEEEEVKTAVAADETDAAAAAPNADDAPAAAGTAEVEAAAAAAASDGDAAAPSAATPSAPKPLAPVRLKPENTLVCAIADTMWDDLVARPRPVARFTYRCFPVPVSTIPTRPDAVAEAATRSAVSWRTETLLPADAEEEAALSEADLKYRKTPVALWTGVSVRNNTNIDRIKDRILQATNDSLIRKTDGGFLMQMFFKAQGAAMVEKTRASLYINVLVMQSVALIAVQPSFIARKQYNLGSVSGDALQLPDMVGSGSAAGAAPTKPAQSMQAAAAAAAAAAAPVAAQGEPETPSPEDDRAV